MNISLITDEISADPETAIEIGVEWGINNFELRGYFNERVPNFSDFQKKKIKSVLDYYQSRIIAISPGIFKIPYSKKPIPSLPLSWVELNNYADLAQVQKQVDYHLHELLPASLDYANELGARKVLIFSFHRGGFPPDNPPHEVLRCYQMAAERAAASDVQLVMENEEDFWGDTGQRTAEIIKTINHPNLRINWDPANAFSSGEKPYPEGYNHVRGYVSHVHFKDVKLDQNGEVNYVTCGEIDWEGQVKSLMQDNYQGFISIETHLKPKISGAKEELERLKKLLSIK